ncbi:MAG: glycosyltransferase family 2 protein [Acidobacteriota bacterium]
MRASEATIPPAVPEPPRSVSLVVPVHDEEENLVPLHREIRQVMSALPLAWELLLVDDGSDDGGPEIMDRLASEDDSVRVLHLACRSGQTGAFLAGFQAARGEVVVTLDADLQNDPADIPRLLSALKDHGAVVGCRQHRRDGLGRRLSSRLANRVRNLMTRETITDTGCSLKAFKREALTGLPQVRGMHRFLPTLVRMAGFSVAEVPVSHRAGRSKYGVGNRLFVGLGDLFFIRWMQVRGLSYKVSREKGRGLGAQAKRF